MQMQLQKIVADALAPPLKRRRGDIRIANLGAQFIERTQARNIGHRFNIKH